MRQITESEFNEVLESTKRENEDRASVGLAPHVVTTKALGSISGSGELVEYYFAGSMFGFIQAGVHYSNGL